MDSKKSISAEKLLTETFNQEIRELQEKFEKDLAQPPFLTKAAKLRFVSCIVNLLPDKLRENLVFFNSAYHKYKVSAEEKLFGLDLFWYILHYKPIVPVHLFEKKDQAKIIRFIKNGCLIALFDLFNFEKLFTQEHYQKQQIYQQLKKQKLKKRGGNWEFLGFESVVDYFEPEVFIEKYGLFYIRNKEKLKGSAVIDCGAYIGDSAYLFNQELKPAQIIALEPDPFNFRKLRENVALNKIENAVTLQKGLSDTPKMAFIKKAGSAGASTTSAIPKEGEPIEVGLEPLDGLVKKLNLTNVGLIKMDIEGAEIKALKGAQTTIKQFKPVLIVSLYHKGQDLFKIPYLVKKLVPDYNLRFVELNAKSPVFERVLIAQI